MLGHHRAAKPRELARNDAVMAPAVYGVTVTGDHDEYTDVVDDPNVPGLTSNDARNSRAAVAAWFDWQLKGKAAVRELFVGLDARAALPDMLGIHVDDDEE